MDAIFSVILTSSLYAGIVGIAILILKKVLKDRINPKWHYLLWIVLVLKLIIPFGPESVISLFNALPRTVHETKFTQQYEEFHKSMNTIRQEKPHVPTTMVVKEVSLSVGAKAERSAPFVWCLGAAVMMCWLLYTNLSFYKKLKRNRRPVPDSITGIFEECKKKASVKRNIEVIIQDTVSTPAIFGVLRPTILLPSKIMKLNDKDISYIILHELSHYKRKDLFANYLLLLLQTIHWFNPVIWLCFKKIRQDMELAADEMVLMKLDTDEHKEYGKAILAVLENFSAVRFAPRLIGMVDEKKNIERRIRMIKMAEIFKSKKRIAVITVTLCIVALGAVLLTSAMPKAEKNEVKPSATGNVINDYDAKRLIKLKTPYVGNNSAVVRVIDNLPLANMRREVSLKTDAKPYGLAVKYDMGTTSLSIEAIENTFLNNAALMFALVGNVDTISFNTGFDEGKKEYKYTRNEIQKNLVKDIKEYAKDESSLNMLINGFGLKLYAFPEKYSPVMSSTPGIRIRPAHLDGGVGVEYTCLKGSLSTWDVLTGKVTQHGKKVRLPYDTPVYWSPLSDGKDKVSGDVSVDVAILKDANIIAEKRINVTTKDSFNFMVETSQDVLIEDSSKDDISDAAKVVTQYFNAFSKTDYKTMCAMATEYHNKELAHSGDVWGMIWAKAKEIKYSGQGNGMLRFFVSVDMETAKTSAQYPSSQTSFYVELIKGADDNWKINNYTTG